MSQITTTLCCCGSPLDGSHDHATCGPPVHETFDIRPIPEGRGVGFSCMQPLQDYQKTHRIELVGKLGVPGYFYNHYVTEFGYDWPALPADVLGDNNYTIDGFSPNLNKELHVGHLRNLALANCLWKLTRKAHSGKFYGMVSLFGASLGIYQWALDKIYQWFNFLDFHPHVYYDVLMPWDLVPRHLETDPVKKTQGCEVWDENPDVIVTTSAGRHTYSFHEIAFSKQANAPTHYLTGAEQVEHFKALGLGDKHLPMGLVLGTDGKKMKSRKQDKDGNEVADSFTAEEAMQEIIGNLNETPEPRKLAWNVIAWNFLHANRAGNVKFDPKKWTQIESPGMYISYTYARVRAALLETPYVGNMGNPFFNVNPRMMKAMKNDFRPEELSPHTTYEAAVDAWHATHPDPQYDLTKEDVELMGFSNYWRHWYIRAVEQMDPAALANFTHDLARKLGEAYHKERLKGGRYGFQYAVNEAWDNLGTCIHFLGMFKLDKV